MIVREVKTAAQAAAAGRKAGGEFPPDFLMEVKPTGLSNGEIVWEWHVWDHMIQDSDASKANYGDVAAHPELVDINLKGGADNPMIFGRGPGAGRGMGRGMGGGMGFGGMGGASDWTHMNSLAYNAELDQIMTTSYGLSEIWILIIARRRRKRPGTPAAVTAKAATCFIAGAIPRRIARARPATKRCSVRTTRVGSRAVCQARDTSSSSTTASGGPRGIIPRWMNLCRRLTRTAVTPSTRRLRAESGDLEFYRSTQDGHVLQLDFRRGSVVQRQHADLLGRTRVDL